MSTNKCAAPRRGEIWWVRFDPKVGAETAKTRPAVVLGVDSIGKLPLRIVVPVTDWKPKYQQFPWFTRLDPTDSNGLSKPSGADSFQVKSVSVARFASRVGRVTAGQITNIAEAVALCIGV